MEIEEAISYLGDSGRLYSTKQEALWSFIDYMIDTKSYYTDIVKQRKRLIALLVELDKEIDKDGEIY